MNKILIIDDEPDNLDAIVDIIECMEDEHTVYQALDGNTALKIVDKVCPDLIITDWEMPEMNGIEFIQKLKSNPKYSDIPVIMCTGVMTTSDNLETALKAGAVDYIRKPVDKIELIARTKSMLELSKSYEEIKELNLSKDKLFSIIAHDLKNPFNALIGITELIIDEKDTIDDKELEDYLKIVNESARRGYDLLENLLEWALSQLNKVKYEPELLNLHDLTEKTIAVLKLNLKAKKLSLKNNIPIDTQCYADKNMIETVLRNLVTNAIKYSFEENKIELEFDKSENEIICSVKDYGTGMSEKVLKNLFSLAGSKSNPGTNNEKGTGLGLILCKELVEKNNGKLWVESKENEGSTFHFSLPSVIKTN